MKSCLCSTLSLLQMMFLSFKLIITDHYAEMHNEPTVKFRHVARCTGFQKRTNQLEFLYSKEKQYRKAIYQQPVEGTEMRRSIRAYLYGNVIDVHCIF